MKKIRIILSIFIGIILIGIFLKYFVSIERIDAGCVGIKVNLVGNNRGVDEITEVTGWVLYMPLFTQIHEFPVFTQVKDYEPFHINAKDGSEFSVDPTFSYYVDRNKVPAMFSQYRRSLKDLEDTYIRNAYQAENKLRQAEAEAKAKIIAAEAEKKANDLKASALTPLIIQQMYIEKWDGKLPQYGEVPRLFKDISKN